MSPTVGARPKTTASYPPAEYRQLRQQNTEQKFLLWWCLHHHLESLPAPPPSAGGEFDLALRSVLRQTAITPPQFNENSAFEDIVSQLYDLHVGTVTKISLSDPQFSFFHVILFCVCSLIIITIEHTLSFIIIITPYHTCVCHNQRVVEPPYRQTRRSVTIRHTRSFLYYIILYHNASVFSISEFQNHQTDSRVA